MCTKLLKILSFMYRFVSIAINFQFPDTFMERSEHKYRMCMKCTPVYSNINIRAQELKLNVCEQFYVIKLL
jgi:hypothetical protein